MNTYRAVQCADGRWRIQWSLDGHLMGLIFGSFDSQAEATFRVYELARMETEEAPRDS